MKKRHYPKITRPRRTRSPVKMGATRGVRAKIITRKQIGKLKKAVDEVYEEERELRQCAFPRCKLMTARGRYCWNHYGLIRQ